MSGGRMYRPMIAYREGGLIFGFSTMSLIRKRRLPSVSPERTVIIEFDSVEAAAAAYDSPAYQEALQALGDGAERDLRIVEAVP